MRRMFDKEFNEKVFGNWKEDNRKTNVATLISVRDKEGNVYSMPSDTPKAIVTVDYCTSYIQFEVQDYYVGDDGVEYFPKKHIFVELSRENWIDWIAVDEADLGEIVKGEK